MKRLEALPEVNSAVSPLSPQGAAFLSKDRTVAYMPVVLGVGPGELDRGAGAGGARRGGAGARGGPATSPSAATSASSSPSPTTGVSEAIGIAAAMVILLFAFGTATAMMLPIGSAILGLACALSIIRLLENVVQVPSVASTLATMIGLGVGIDYALFIVTRHKLQLARRDGAARVDRPGDSDGGRRRRLRRLHRGDRALLARLRRDPAGRHARLHRGDRGRGRGLRRGDAAAGDARRARPAHQLAAGAARQDPPRRQEAARLAALGRRRRRRGRGARRSPPWRSWSSWRCRSSSSNWARTTSAPCPRTTTARQAYDGLTEGFGPGVNGPLLIASEFDRRRRKRRGCCRALEKQIGARPRRRRGLREPTFDKAGDGRGLHGDLATRRRGPTRPSNLVEQPARQRRSPKALAGTGGVRPTSAARPPATSTSPPRSPTSCR